MASHHLIDPQLVEGLAAFPPFDTISAETLPMIRAAMGELARQQIADTPLDGIVFEERKVPGPEGAPDLRVLVYRPAAASGPRPAYLHVHGGGLIIGAPEMRHIGSVAIARQFDCVVVSVDYRLAPETHFPGAVEDCHAALKWLHDEAETLGGDRTRLVIGGESAGGGLAAATAILARDRGEVPLAFQHLTYPMLDDRTAAGHDHPHVGHFVWTQPNNHFGWSAYLGAEPGSAGVSPYAAPARCEDLSGLPPAFIATGSLDLFLEEDMEYARRLLRAGVPTELHVYPGAFHAFDLIVDADVTQSFRRDWQAALTKALAR